jgi:hypothetical protein
MEVLSLQGTTSGLIAVPLEWTDQSPPPLYEILGTEPPLLDVRCLLQLADLVQQLSNQAKKGVDK